MALPFNNDKGPTDQPEKARQSRVSDEINKAPPTKNAAIYKMVGLL
jgi:hypothetical protein